MKNLFALGFIFLVWISCSDDTINPDEYSELTNIELEDLFNYSKSFPYSFSLISSDSLDTLIVEETIVFAIDSLDYISNVVGNTSDFASESRYDPEFSVISSQQVIISFNYRATEGRYLQDSTFSVGTEEIIFTSSDYDSLYQELGFNFQSPKTFYSIFNFNLDNNIEKNSFDIFSGAVPINSLVYFPDSSFKPNSTRLFRLYNNKVVFGGFLDSDNSFQKEIFSKMDSVFSIRF